MKKKYKFIFFLFLQSFSLIGQREDYTWMLGTWGTNPVYSLMSLNFNNKMTIKGYKEAKISISFSNASISDSLGNLLFFSNGKNLYDKEFMQMKGENNINIDSILHLNNGAPTQNTIILPFPGKKNVYAFFYLPLDLAPLPCSKNLSLAVIDMKKNNNLGEVILRKKIILEDSLEVGKITATKHANGRDWWLITQKDDENIYYKTLLTPQGATVQNKQTIGNDFFSDDGQVVFSPDGKYYINFDLIIDSTVSSPHIMVFEFDRCTGKLNNPRSIKYPFSQGWSGGIAVSPNSRYLYVSYFDKLYQYDLWTKDILTSEKIVGEYDGFIYDDVFTTRFNLTQLAPDDKIYISTRGATPYLHVINNPDLEGKACNFVQRGLVLPFVNAWSVPNHPNYRLGALKGSPCDSLGSVAVQELKEENFKVYPNPASDVLNIEVPLSMPSATILLRDIQGRLLKSIAAKGDTQIDISDLPNGLFFIEIWVEKQRITTKKVIIIN